MTRQLAHGFATVEEAHAALLQLEAGIAPFNVNWIETTEPSHVARAHIVEIHVVAVKPAYAP